jgi:hypothetical protein
MNKSFEMKSKDQSIIELWVLRSLFNYDQICNITAGYVPGVSHTDPVVYGKRRGEEEDTRKPHMQAQ